MVDENTENDDDIDLDDDDDIDLGLDDDADFDDLNGGGKTLGDLWNSNPLVKVGTILVAVVIVFVIIIQMGSEPEVVEQSLVSGGSDISSPPATSEAPPAYVEAIEETNEEAIDEAFKSGGSAIPVPISTPRGLLEIEDDSEPSDEEDPLERWRRLQEERIQREMEAQPVIDQELRQQQQRGPDPALQALADTMSQQMQSILENQTTISFSHYDVASKDYIQEQKIRDMQGQIALMDQEKALADKMAEISASAGLAFGGSGANSGNALAKPIIPAGEIVYAQLITEANSDTPGPVLAQIAGGPLSGSRILGDFSVQGELLVLSFNTIVIDDIAQSTSAVAIDPNTTLPGMATEVDHRYLRRIVLPAAAAFIEGAAEAISESGRTTITVDGGAAVSSTSDATNEQEIASGIEELGEEIGDIMDDIADETEILVRIDSGTPMGILFLQGVFPPGSNQTNAQQQQQNVNPIPFTGTNATGSGFSLDSTSSAPSSGSNPLEALNLFQTP